MRALVGALVAAMVALPLLVAPAQAVQPDEMLKDPALEARARALSADIRCLVCQNQSIDDSDASLARDMRKLVREQITAGKSDQAIRDFLVARYGDFVLLKPPVRRSTWLLWFGPLIVFLLGAGGLLLYFRSRTRTSAGPAGGLSRDEEERIERLLSDSEARK